jgi:hypothetical protein
MRCLLTYLGDEIGPRARTVIVAGAQYSELLKPDAIAWRSGGLRLYNRQSGFFLSGIGRSAPFNGDQQVSAGSENVLSHIRDGLFEISLGAKSQEFAML